jgi:Ca-activated chloride channel family protein
MARTGVLVAVAVGISVITMIGLSARAVIVRASCSSHPAVVNVVVSYDIAPAIQKIARAFNSQNETAGDKCVQVQVTQAEPSAVAAQVDGQDSVKGMTAIDAWIPDSSLWVDVARSYPVGAQVIQPTGIDVARSPIMLVTSQAVAAKTDVFGAPPSWNLLVPQSFGGPPTSMGLAVDMPDPTDSAVGLATLIEVNRELGPTAEGRNGLTKFVFSTESTEDFDAPGALKTFVASTGPPFFRTAITEASEQAVIAYDRANPKQPVAARYPAAASPALGSPELDYPYVLTTSNAAILPGASAFGKYLQGGYAQSVIRYFGFRSSAGVPDSFPAGSGLSSQPLQIASPPSASEAATSLASWQKLGLGSRDLTLIDDSAAMGAPSGIPDVSLEEELTQTAARGLALFPDSTQMGLWEIPDSQASGQPYKSLVSIGPLPAEFGVMNRRDQLQEIIAAALRPARTPLHLHDAILAAYQDMVRTYAPNYANAVLVLTSGVDAPGDMSLQALVSKLHQLYTVDNPTKKVEIVIIQFGQQGSYQALQEIADTTGGAAYQVVNPTEIGKIFIEAIAHRMCDQGCTAP